MSSLFRGYQFALELEYSFRYKQKQELKKKITNNGGTISYVLTKEINFLIVSNINQADTTYKGRTAQKNGTPIVNVEFISRCVKEGRVVDPSAYLANGGKQLAGFERGKIKVKSPPKKSTTAKTSKFNLNSVQVWTWGENKAPDFDEDSYEVAKCCLLLSSSKSNDGDLFHQIELHVLPLANQTSENTENKYCFRVFSHHGNCSEVKNESSGTRKCRYLTSSSDALKTYAQLYYNICSNKGYKKCKKFISRWIGSDKQRKISLESSYESGAISSEVVDLVEHIWQEANEQINGMLSLPEESMKKEHVEKAEATLLQIRHELDSRQRKTELDKLSKQLFEILPLKKGRTSTIQDKAMLSKMHDICQLLKDMVSVSEATDFSARTSIESKFHALRCHIEHLPSSTPEYKQILDLVKSNNERNNFDIKNIFAVNRSIEETNFTHRLGNKKLLFHASNPANFVGIFTRGLLLPKIVVNDFGGKRTDPGNLGSGIYFTDSSSTSAKYSSRSTVKGSRFMLVNEVALGKCLDMMTKNYKLSAAPEGYSSVHAVKRAIGKKSVFEDNEYVVYNTKQQRIRYLIEFALPEDRIINFIQKSLKETLDEEDDAQMMDISIDDIQSLKNPLDNVQAGLQSKDNTSVPLTAVHIRAKLIDLAAQVVVLQAYKNENNHAIEAKYVFPLDDMAAVCGFEAFIDGKHIVGEVKDKEVAHQEYREAISKGHGAYLMDEETPDVFTVSVGNLTPNSEVLIKITYVAELTVDCGKIVFNLPGSVAPWKKDGALSVKTQAELLTKKISGQPPGKTSIQIAVEMPYDIRSIKSPTHELKLKHSTTKATVELEKEVSLDDGFQLLIELAEVHVPRMWVERHPEKVDSQACMLTFYPEFESESNDSPEILLVLDLSNSMKGDNLVQAKKILLMNLQCLPAKATFNIITFGTNFDELFPASQPNTNANIYTAKTFIRNVRANMGNTEVWRPLHAYFLLSDTTCLRNIFLISDGHINNEESTLNAIQLHAKSNRVFTFGISKTANKHLLRAIARVGTGAFEFFDTSTKSKWERKVKGQLLKARQPALSNVSVEWQQFDDNATKPIQAPGQITSLFSGSRQVVYGYVPFCRQATLKAEINGDEISTMVSTNELNVTRGKILHQLTARAIIRDWEDGTLDADPMEHNIKKDAQKSYIIDLSKEYSIVTQFTSFIAIEEREKTDFVGAVFKPSINDLVANEDIDDLPYVGWEDTDNLNIQIYPFNFETSHESYDECGDYILRDSEDFYVGHCESRMRAPNPFDHVPSGTGRSRRLHTIEAHQSTSQEQRFKSLGFTKSAKKSVKGHFKSASRKKKSFQKVCRRNMPIGMRAFCAESPGMHGIEEEERDMICNAISLSCQDDGFAMDDLEGLSPIPPPTPKRSAFPRSARERPMALSTRSRARSPVARSYGTPPPALCAPMQRRLTSSDDSEGYAPAYPTMSLNEVAPVRNYKFLASSSCSLMPSDIFEDIPLCTIESSYASPQLRAKASRKYKRSKGFGFGFPNVGNAIRRSGSKYRKSDKKPVDYDMLSLYRESNVEGRLSRYLRSYAREDIDVYIMSEECKDLCIAVRRAINKQNSDGSWPLTSIQELTELKDIILDRDCPVFFVGTAVVTCLLELVLLNWKRICKALHTFKVNSVYQDAFNCLMEAESFLRNMRLGTGGQDNWLEYAEIQILDVSLYTDVVVNSSLFIDPAKLISFEQRIKVLKKSELWLKKSFWTLSPSFAVLFGIKRRKIVALLKQSGIKELDLKIQEEVHSMLALAIGIWLMSAHMDDGVTTTMVKTVQTWLHEKEIPNPGLASQLKLGGDWMDVASKMCKKHK